MRYHLLLLVIALPTWLVAAGQPATGPVDTGTIDHRYLKSISCRAQSLSTKVDRSTQKALRALQRQEERVQQKLARKDSLKAAELSRNSRQHYEQLAGRLQSPVQGQGYVPALDTLATSLQFLQQYPHLLKDPTASLPAAMDKVNELQRQLTQAEAVTAFLKQRQQYLRQQWEQSGIGKELKKLNKQVYYYQAQVQEYKSLVKDHRKAEKKALDLLSKTKAFQDFMRRNSQLASLFRLPGNSTTAPGGALAGLQTRAQVNNLIGQQLAAGGPNAREQFSQQLQQAQAQLQELKGRLNQWGNSSAEGALPEGFKPNHQRTKTFLQRLAYGMNVQSQRGTGFLPVTSDIGVSIGYKLNDKSVVGIGGSYKMGWGEGWRHLRLTHEGVGLRSFVDYKVKGSWWLAGGYERNYRQRFRHIEVLKERKAWQESGLLGVSKQVPLKTKWIRQTKVMLLWDFMSYRQVPRAQPVLFRVGYNF